MTSPNFARRHLSPQAAEGGTDSDWAHGISPLPSDHLDLPDSFQEPWTYSFTPATDLENDFLDDAPHLYSMEDSYLDSNADVTTPVNALGLDNVSLHTRVNDATPTLMLHTPRARPQINTDLHQVHAPFPPSPYDQSPYTMNQPPLSATTSTPSSMGHYSIPRTPAALPSQPTFYFPPAHSGLLSPHTPYGVCYPPVRTSPSPSSSFMAPSPLASSPGALTNLQTVFEIASRYPGADNLLQQKLYRPNTQSDRRRYVEEVVLEQPIMFFASNGETCGIRCVDALSSRFAGLQGRDDSMFEQRGPSVSIRLMWPGYAPWSRQIPTRDFRSPPQPITRAKLAKNVAKTIKRFIEDMEGKPMEDDGHRQFKVGRQYISIDDLELVGLQHVSMGSWQAHVRLHRRG